MGLNQFFSYFGSKSRLSSNYPAPKHGKIVEPFAGSAGYSCLHYQSQVTLYEKDPVIHGIWKFLIEASEGDILGLPLDVEGLSALSGSPRNLIGFWFQRGGTSPLMRMNAWGRSGKYPYSFWSLQTRRRIARQVEEIKHWRAFNLPYEDLVPSEATWFVDPPYESMGNYYRHGPKGIDYQHLAEWCKRLPGQVIVCEEAGAKWLPFSPLYRARNVRNSKYQEGCFLVDSEAGL